MNEGKKTSLLLFDDYWIDFKKNLIRRWYQPEPVGQYRDPYCGAGCYHSACWSPELGAYLMWYEYLPDHTDDEPRYLSASISDDGIDWRPLEVRKAEPERMIYPNTVYMGNIGLHGTAVMRDEREADPRMRYKACGCTRSGLWRTAGKQNSEIRVSTSPDGLAWTEREELLVHPHTSDTYNQLYYNPVSGEYNALLRAGFVDRRICIRRSKDLIRWTPPQVCIHPGADFCDDAYAVQLYGMNAHWARGCFIGFLWRYHTSCVDFDYTRMNGFMDTELTYSYDGEHWMRTTGEAIVPRPLPPAMGASQLCVSNLHETREGDRYRLLASGSSVMHGTARQIAGVRQSELPQSALLIYEIRRDGFCGLEANAADGLLITKTFELCEPDLTFNIRADFGCARFAMLTHEGKAYEGFGFEDSVPFSGNALSHSPQWKERAIGELAGKRVRIAVEMNGAVLHAVYGSLRPWIRYIQESINDPLHIKE